MNTTPQGERRRIVIVGRCNAGKSSLINALTGQPVAIVSGERGTTTDPVRKAMELLPAGPVLLCDTAGLDDDSALGAARLEKTRAELRQADLVLLVVDMREECGAREAELLAECQALGVPAITVLNKSDLGAQGQNGPVPGSQCASGPSFMVSALTGAGVRELKAAMAKALTDAPQERRLVADLVAPGDAVVLVVPIDKAAPKGRLILPQQQAIRDLLEAGAIPVVARDTELPSALAALKAPPALVITDSQAFAKVAAVVPPEVPLTSFSILLARYKGDLAALAAGARAVASLKDGDRILIAEGCTHHRQDDDIGTVKIPRMLQARTGRKLVFSHCSGVGFPDDLSDFALVVHCGACMLSRREMLSRIAEANSAGVPVVNYGVLLAALGGILDRAMAPLVQ